MYPTTAQKKKLKQWIGLQRWVYNKCVSEVTSGCPVKIKELRSRIINSQTYTHDAHWLQEYDYDLKDEAIRTFIKNYKSNYAKYKIDKIPFTIGYKSLRQQRSCGASLSVLSKKWNQKNSTSFYFDIFNSSNKIMKTSEKLPAKLSHDCRIQVSPSGEYFFILSTQKTKRPSPKRQENTIALDPGVRTFLTGFNPAGSLAVIGDGDFVALKRLLDINIPIVGNHNQRRNKKRAMARHRRRIWNLVEDFQRKVCKWLCDNHTDVYIPILNFHSCRNLNKRSKRLLATLRWASFVDKLRMKSEEFDCNIHVVNEAWTSKTCGNCGQINRCLGSSKTFICGNCELVIDRDVNGARNIYLRSVFASSNLKNNEPLVAPSVADGVEA